MNKSKAIHKKVFFSLLLSIFSIFFASDTFAAADTTPIEKLNQSLTMAKNNITNWTNELKKNLNVSKIAKEIENATAEIIKLLSQISGAAPQQVAGEEETYIVNLSDGSSTKIPKTLVKHFLTLQLLESDIGKEQIADSGFILPAESVTQSVFEHLLEYAHIFNENHAPSLSDNPKKLIDELMAINFLDNEQIRDAIINKLADLIRNDETINDYEAIRRSDKNLTRNPLFEQLLRMPDELVELLQKKVLEKFFQSDDLKPLMLTLLLKGIDKGEITASPEIQSFYHKTSRWSQGKPKKEYLASIKKQYPNLQSENIIGTFQDIHANVKIFVSVDGTVYIEEITGQDPATGAPLRTARTTSLELPPSFKATSINILPINSLLFLTYFTRRVAQNNRKKVDAYRANQPEQQPLIIPVTDGFIEDYNSLHPNDHQFLGYEGPYREALEKVRIEAQNRELRAAGLDPDVRKIHQEARKQAASNQ